MMNQVNSPGLWALAWRRLKADSVAMISLGVVSLFMLLLMLSYSGLIAADWDTEAGVSYAPPGFLHTANQQLTQPPGEQLSKPEATPVVADNPLDPLRDVIRELNQAQGNKDAAATTSQSENKDSSEVVDPIAQELAEIQAELAKKQQTQIQERADSLPFGADKWGHDIIKKTIKGAETSILVGIVAALLATLLGTLFGATAGYFGGRVDDFFNWFYSIFTSIPYLLLILSVAAVLQQKGVGTIILILALTGWTGPFRLIRAEYMKHKAREYVWAADAIGASHLRKMFIHIFPNISHVALVQVSILVVGFIKSEVILSFLGFGVPVGTVSWGSMLNEAQNELILGKWWQLTAATAAMALLVTAFSLFTDALRDALDPKLK
ncbi:ABC transporter permease [Undibacterium rugosum]|uniref:ABC transporter permease n=1 Tax=Undibacterium rugosum TaxID=2762291 RepID=UPI001B81AD3F|nr:ABC transporter permease [Undibacterium rugosum]MBR7780338.1 ABC transporter permease [Undibacterium rugosum]